MSAPIDTAPFPIVTDSGAQPAVETHPGHSPATLKMSGPFMKAHREIGKLIAARPDILPGLHRTAVDNDGTITFMYAGVVGTETTSSWTAPDGLLSTWRSLLTNVGEREEYVERGAQLGDQVVPVQDRHITVAGSHDGLRVRILMTAAGLPRRSTA